MNRAAQGVVLLLVGGAVLRTGLTDLYLRYVKEGLRPFLVVAGVALVVIAVGTLIPEFSGRGDADDHDTAAPLGTDSAGHDHAGHTEPRVSWLLLLPVLALLMVAPPALGADAATRAGTALATAEGSDFPPLPTGDPTRIPVLDYAARAVYEDGVSLRDRRIELSGFILVGEDGRRYLARMILSCCASDARPIKVGLAGDVPDVAQQTWVRVVGRYTPKVVEDAVNGEQIPFIEVESMERIPAPRKQYE